MRDSCKMLRSVPGAAFGMGVGSLDCKKGQLASFTQSQPAIISEQQLIMLTCCPDTRQLWSLRTAACKAVSLHAAIISLGVMLGASVSASTCMCGALLTHAHGLQLVHAHAYVRSAHVHWCCASIAVLLGCSLADLCLHEADLAAALLWLDWELGHCLPRHSCKGAYLL